jgi:hypothetical protein
VVNHVRTRLADVLRSLTAAAVLLSAVVHLDLYGQGFGQLPTIGPLFLLNVVVGLGLGIVVTLWRHWLPVGLAAGFGLVTVAAYWVSVVHGLFGVREVVTGWSEVLAEVAEYSAIACGLAAALLLRAGRRLRGSRP